MEQAHDRTLRAARGLEAIAEPTLDLRPVALAVERALAAEYAIFDERGDRLEAAQTAIASLGEARSLLSTHESEEPIAAVLPHLNEAISSISAAQDPLSRMFPQPPRPGVDLMASQGAPMLHAPARPPLVPTLRVKMPLGKFEGEPPLPPIEQPKTFADLDRAVAEMKRRKAEREKEAAERAAAKKKKALAPKPDGTLPDVPEGFTPKLPKPMTEDEFIQHKARELFEEISMVGMQRTPLLGDPFRSTAFLERRLLAALDALVGYGFTAIRYVEPMVIDSPAKDAARAFGAAIFFGSLDGRDSLGAAERILRYCGAGDPEVAKGFSGALSLAPHPSLPTMLRTMMLDEDPAYRALALEVLIYRELATGEELIAALADPAPEVASQALPALALMKWQGTAQAAEPWLAHDEPRMREAAWHALAYSAHMNAVRVLEDELDGERGGRAAELLGLLVESRDAEYLLTKMQEKPVDARIAAVGWSGTPAAIPVLIGFLGGRAKKEAKITAAYALDRITGARLWESVEIDPEEILVEEPEEPAVDLDGKGKPKPKSLAQTVSDPRDLPGKGAADTMMRPTIDAQRWRAWWKEASPRYQMKSRYRRGHPYTPIISLWEMADGWVITPYERRLLQKELIVRTGDHARFDPHDWIPVQEESLKQWEERARRSSGAPGEWARAMTRR